jgi:hypothetical protein
MHLTLSYTHCKGAAHTSNFVLTTSTYKITNHVFDNIDLMSSFNFLLQVLHNIYLKSKKTRPTSKKLYTHDSQDAYRKRGKNEKSRGERRRGLTLARIVLHHNKNFRGACPKRERNGKNRARSGVATVLP